MTSCRACPRWERKHGTFYIYLLAIIRYSNVAVDGFGNDAPSTYDVAFAGCDGC
jgi:hypothetical protein